MVRLSFFIVAAVCCLGTLTSFAYNRQDTLRGSNGRGRSWWDVQHYSLTVRIDTATQTISGENNIAFTVLASGIDSMQIDLQDSLIIESVEMVNADPSYIKFLERKYGTEADLSEVFWRRRGLEFSREGNVYWLKFYYKDWKVGSEQTIRIRYSGRPRIAKHAPWDGGFIWTRDSLGNPWYAVACQGLGASAWWPCKDYQGDEPDRGTKCLINIQTEHMVITNGREFPDTTMVEDPVTGDVRALVSSYRSGNVTNPINSYDVTFYIGDYVSWADTMMGEKGKLDLSFSALRYNEQKARKQFAVAKQMLHCFEYWMGPYPFYEDGYKLVEAPYLGMEHQSAVAYGNQYKMGYLGNDRSGTGVGLLFDFIIVHESGHEWFGNNITAQDIADNWLHEGLTTYTEALFAECAFGKEKAFQYTTGEWKNIRNDRPVIGDYGVNDDGSGDKYDKGSAVVHMIRMIMNNDERFRQLLRGLNRDFYHRIVTSAQVEQYINDFAYYDFTPLFNQYLRTTDIPKLEWYIKKSKLHYRFTNIVEGFTLPLDIRGGQKKAVISPTAEWQSISWKGGYGIEFSKNFLVKTGE